MKVPVRLKSIAIIATGTAIGQAISLLGIAVVTRLFTPADFGTFSVLFASAMVFATIISARLDLAVPLPKSEDDARSLVTIGAIIAIGAIAAGSIVVGFNLFNVTSTLPPPARDLAWTIPVILIPFATFQLLNAWAIRQSRYKAIASRSILVAVVTMVAQVGAGLIGYGVLGLLGGYVLGQLVGTLALMRGADLTHSGTGRTRPKRQVLSEYRRFPIILTPTGLVNSLGVQLPVIMIGALYGLHAAGFLALAQRVLGLPTALIGQSVGQVFVSEMAKLRRESGDGLRELFVSTTKYLSIAAGLALVAVVVAAPIAFELTFGSQWRDAGLMAQALGILIASQLIGSPVSQTLMVFNRLAVIAAWDVLRLLIVAGSLLLSNMAGLSAVEAVWALSVAQGLLYAGYWWLSWRTIIVSERRTPTHRA